MRNTAAELTRVDELLMTAYDSPSRRCELALYLAMQPDGWYVMIDGDHVAAVGGGISYGSFCWLGLVATDPRHRRQGLATMLTTHLVRWARELGCTTIALDASRGGRPVYERLGFHVVGETLELSLTALLADGEAPDPVSHIEDIGVLCELDRRVFGGDRSHLIRALARDPRCRCYLVRDRGRLVGFLFAGDRLLGPGCALDDVVASKLLRATTNDATTCTNTDERRLIVPVESARVNGLLALGLHERRRLTHMRLGELELPGDRHHLLAQASFAAG